MFTISILVRQIFSNIYIVIKQIIEKLNYKYLKFKNKRNGETKSQVCDTYYGENVAIVNTTYKAYTMRASRSHANRRKWCEMLNGRRKNDFLALRN